MNIGLGRFGTSLALELTRRGTDVLAIDNQPTVAQRLAGSLARVIAVDSTDIDALREIGVDELIALWSRSARTSSRAS
ncbi:MAG TPA: NAD-binding protein [Propionibacteriaceae bacterium]|nr:NAD-binding protein [Propionibacteriaceae bacterium]